MSEKNWVIVTRAAIAAEDANAPKQHSLWTPQCPPLPRFAADEPDWSEAEQQHIAGCGYCRKNIAIREQLLEEERKIIRFPTPVRLPAPQRYTAKEDHPLDETGSGEDGLTWRLVEDEGQVRFWVKSKRQELAGRTVAYSLYGGEGKSIEGTLPLTEEDGWVLAEKAFAAKDLDEALAGECRAVRVRLDANGSA